MSYARCLEEEFAARPFPSKGERTRFRLKIAAAQALEEIGFQACTVADICRRAQLALGTFYVYFTDKSDIAGDVLMEFGEAVHARARGISRGSGNFDAIRLTNRFFIDTYRANPGLLRSLFQLEDHAPEFRRRRREQRAQWIARIARSIRRRTDGPRAAQGLYVQVAYALECMVFQYLYDVFVKQDPALSLRAGKSDHIAELLSILWHRAVYCDDPPPEAVKHARAALRLGRARRPRKR